MWVPFLRPLPGAEAHNFFWGSKRGVFWVGAKKFMLKKFMCFFGPLVSGGKKNNKHKQLRGIVPEMGGGQIVYVFPFFLGKKGNT